MADLKLGEAISDAMVAKLKAGLAARITTINAAKTDLTLAAPDDDAYFTARETNFPKTPSIFVMEGPTIFDNPAEGPQSFITKTDMLVYVFESDQNGDLLGKRLKRQVRAIIETLWDDAPKQQLTGSAFRIAPRRTQPGPVFEPERDHDWRGFYVITFRAEQLEG